MTGLRKYPPAIDSPEWNDLVDFLGGITAETQISTAKIILAEASPTLLNSWQYASDKTKIDGAKVVGIPVGSISPLTGDLNFDQHLALNILIDVLTGDPSSPLPGQVWYRSDLEKLSLRRASVTDRLVLEALSQTLTNKTLTNPVIAALGPNVSQQHTVPAVASDTFALLNATQTLAGKTLTTPTIGSFTNATHSHQNAAGGGQLDHGAALTGLGDDDHTQYVLRSIMTTRGDLFYRNASAVTRLGLGSAGKMLRSNGTDLAYSTFAIPDTFGSGDLIYASAANVLAGLAINATATRKFLRAVSSGLAWDTLVAGDIPQLDHGGLAGLADDDHTQYLNVARHDVVSRHPVTVGGTGLATIAAGGILYASALDTLSRIAPSAANQVLRSTAANALEIAALAGADIPSLDTSKITTGRFAFSRIPDAATNKFIRSQGVGVDSIYDTLVAADIPGLDAAKITTGRFGLARLPDAASGFMKAQGVGVDPAYSSIYKADVSDFAHKSTHVADGADEFADGDLLKANARITVRKNSGSNVGTRRRLNLIQGSNVTLSVTDDSVDEEVDITISASGGGGGGGETTSADLLMMMGG